MVHRPRVAGLAVAGPLIAMLVGVAAGGGCSGVGERAPDLSRTELLSAGRCEVAAPAGGDPRGAAAIDCFFRVPPRGGIEIATEPADVSASVDLSLAHDQLGEIGLQRQGVTGRWRLPAGNWQGEIVSLRLRSGAHPPQRWEAIDLVGESVVLPGIVGREMAQRSALPEERPTEVAEVAPINVIFYLVDTLRADRLSLYGYDRETSPALDRFAKSAFVFDNAYSPGSMTADVIAPIFVSALRLGARHLQVDTGAPEERTLPEVMSSAGYRTAAFQANFTLRSALGYDRGFDVYQTVTAAREDGLPGIRAGNADEVQAKALDWMSRQGREPFFLYMQTMEPHNPYNPPAKFRGKFGGRYTPPAEREISIDEIFRSKGKDPASLDPRKREAGQEVLDQLWQLDPNRYDECVAYVDDAFGRFVAELARRGLLERTLIVLTADHGEALGDGGVGRRRLHGFSLHEELVHVPLVIRFPGQASGRRVADVVSLMDLAPTIVEAVGQPVPDLYRGHSMFAPRPPYPAAFGERFDRRGRIDSYVREGPWKVIGGDRVGYRLYDLDNDRHEKKDLAAARPITLAYLRLRMDELLHSMSGEPPPPATLSAEEREKVDEALHALGYKD